MSLREQLALIREVIERDERAGKHAWQLAAAKLRQWEEQIDADDSRRGTGLPCGLDPYGRGIRQGEELRSWDDAPQNERFELDYSARVVLGAMRWLQRQGQLERDERREVLCMQLNSVWCAGQDAEADHEIEREIRGQMQQLAQAMFSALQAGAAMPRASAFRLRIRTESPDARLRFVEGQGPALEQLEGGLHARLRINAALMLAREVSDTARIRLGLHLRRAEHRTDRELNLTYVDMIDPVLRKIEFTLLRQETPRLMAHGQGWMMTLELRCQAGSQGEAYLSSHGPQEPQAELRPDLERALNKLLGRHHPAAQGLAAIRKSSLPERCREAGLTAAKRQLEQLEARAQEQRETLLDQLEEQLKEDARRRGKAA